MLGLLLRQCLSAQCHVRQFSSSFAWQINRKKNKDTIRVPSKKAMAAKLRRKALAAAKDDQRYLKLTIEDAIAVLRAVEVTAPWATYELTIRTQLGNGQAVPRGRVNLPREAKAKTEDTILVFAEGRQAEEAKQAGAHIVGGLELIEGIVSNRVRATTILSTPALAKAIAPKLGRFLGPLGLMPSERRGTVTEDIVGYIERMRGSSEWRADKSGTIRAPIAMMNFPVVDVVSNFRHFLLSVKRATGHVKDPNAVERKTKGPASNRPVTPITKVILSSTQGPGIRISDY